jgi:diketogulonate reductase-like aldo/keto reductase
MAYSPSGQGDPPVSKALASIAHRLDATPFQVARARVLRDPSVIAIPKASNRAHLEANHRPLQLRLTADDLIAIDAAFRPPTRKSRRAML